MRKRDLQRKQLNLFRDIPGADQLERERRNKLARQRRWLARLRQMPEDVQVHMKRVRELVEIELEGQA